jgi:hypothetical protein
MYETMISFCFAAYPINQRGVSSTLFVNVTLKPELALQFAATTNQWTLRFAVRQV